MEILKRLQQQKKISSNISNKTQSDSNDPVKFWNEYTVNKENIDSNLNDSSSSLGIEPSLQDKSFNSNSNSTSESAMDSVFSLEYNQSEKLGFLDRLARPKLNAQKFIQTDTFSEVSFDNNSSDRSANDSDVNDSNYTKSSSDFVSKSDENVDTVKPHKVNVQDNSHNRRDISHQMYLNDDKLLSRTKSSESATKLSKNLKDILRPNVNNLDLLKIDSKYQEDEENHSSIGSYTDGSLFSRSDIGSFEKLNRSASKSIFSAQGNQKVGGSTSTLVSERTSFYDSSIDSIGIVESGSLFGSTENKKASPDISQQGKFQSNLFVEQKWDPPIAAPSYKYPYYDYKNRSESTLGELHSNKVNLTQKLAENHEDQSQFLFNYEDRVLDSVLDQSGPESSDEFVRPVGRPSHSKSIQESYSTTFDSSTELDFHNAPYIYEQLRTPHKSSERRPRRKRFQPLAFWRNERVVYRSTPHDDFPVIDGIIRNVSTPTPLRRRRRGANINFEADYDPVSHFLARSGNNEEERLLCILKPDFRLLTEDNDRVLIADSFGGVTGWMKIMSGGHQEFNPDPEQSKIFFVVHGPVIAKVNKTHSKLLTGATLLIPPNNSFSLTNTEKISCILGFVALAGDVRPTIELDE